MLPHPDARGDDATAHRSFRNNHGLPCPMHDDAIRSTDRPRRKQGTKAMNTGGNPTTCAKALAEILDALCPASLLWLGTDAPDAMQPITPRQSACELTSVTDVGVDVTAMPRAAAAVVAKDWLAKADSTQATRTIAALRDLQAEVVIAVAGEDCVITATQWRALGFRVHQHTSEATIHAFNLFDYKRRPDWLNPRHWANPELWDKYRW